MLGVGASRALGLGARGALAAVLGLALTACVGTAPPSGDDDDSAETVLCYRDADGDGYGFGAERWEAAVCDSTEGMTRVGGDCDDTTVQRSPDNTEIPDDGIDQDCDGLDLISCFYDGDGDGRGFPTPTYVHQGTCGDAPSESLFGDDCDDADPTVHPAAIEICDRLDQDCDGVFDSGDFHYLSGGSAASFDVPPLPLTWGDFTIEARLDVQGHELASGLPLLRKVSAAGVEELRIDNGPPGATRWTVRLAGQEITTIVAPPIPLWPAPQHLALVSQGPGLRFYVNGSLASTWTGDPPSSWSPDGFWRFLTEDPDDEFGRSLIVDLKELRIWSRARSDSELAANVCRPLRQTDRSGLELYLPFEGGGADFSGHGRTPSYVNGQLQAPGGL